MLDLVSISASPINVSQNPAEIILKIDEFMGIADV